MKNIITRMAITWAIGIILLVTTALLSFTSKQSKLFSARVVAENYKERIFFTVVIKAASQDMAQRKFNNVINASIGKGYQLYCYQVLELNENTIVDAFQPGATTQKRNGDYVPTSPCK